MLPQQFSQIPVLTLFSLNGTAYVKNSSRTGRMLSTGRVFYIGQREPVKMLDWATVKAHNN